MQKRLVILMGLFGLTLVGVQAATRTREAQLKHPYWSAVPFLFDGWKGFETSFDPVYGTDPAESSLLRVYSKENQIPIVVYVGYYSDLAKILEVHTPELCYQAQGWTILSDHRISGGLYRGQEIHAKEIVVEKQGSRRLVTWWYNAGSRPIQNRIRYIYAMLAMSTISGRTDGSLVRIETPVNSSNIESANARVEEFREKFLPLLEKALP